MPKPLLSIAGRTQDGLDCFGGVYKLYETIGCPLDVIVALLLDAGGLVAWDRFFDDAIAAGMRPSRVRSMVAEALVDQPAARVAVDHYLDGVA